MKRLIENYIIIKNRGNLLHNIRKVVRKSRANKTKTKKQIENIEIQRKRKKMTTKRRN